MANSKFDNNFIENDLMILTKQTVDIFLKQKNNSELIALYVFYYYTAKWQKTNQPKCTTDYVANALHWDIRKVRKAKKQLIEIGLIEDVRKVDPETKKVVGYYIKINYIFKKETVEESLETLEENQGCKNALLGKKARGAFCHRVAFCTPNALSTNNINALSTNNNKKERKEDLNDNSLLKSECKNENEIKKISAEKNSTEKKKTSFDVIIENYTQNEKLRTELKEHLRVRKAKRAALTDHALELSLKKLNSIANSEEEKIEIVQNAIMSGWTAFYPLRTVKTNSVFSTSSYNINDYEKTMDVFDAQVKKEEERRKQEQEQAKLKEIIARDHDKNVERYGKQDAEDLEMSETVEEYYETIGDYERRMSKGLLPNGDYPPELSYLENNLFESPEEEARAIAFALSGPHGL